MFQGIKASDKDIRCSVQFWQISGAFPSLLSLDRYMRYSAPTLKKKNKFKKQYGLLPVSEIMFYLSKCFSFLAQTPLSFHRSFTALDRRLLCWPFHAFSGLMHGDVKVSLELPDKTSVLGSFKGYS